MATVTLTRATGGGAISADTAANGPTPGWTELTPITIAEGGSAKADIGAGTLVLRAPAGFVFDTSTVPSIAFTPGRNITAADIAFTSSNLLTITLTVNGGDAADSFTIGGTTPVLLQPVEGTPLASGTLHRPSPGGGNALIAGVISTSNPSGVGGTSFGALATVAGAARKLVMTSATPLAVTAGAVISPSPVVLAQDQFDNLRSSDNSLVITAGIGTGTSTLQGTRTATVSAGTAVFTGLSYNVAETITLTFAADGVTPATSAPITVNPAIADRLGFEVQPAGGTYGGPLSRQPVVHTRDRFGNPSKAGLPSSRLVALSLTGGTGSLTGGTTLDIGTAAGNGTVTFADLAITAAGTNKQLTASAGGLAAGTSDLFAVEPAPLIPTVTVNNKVYDGTTSASIASRSVTGTLGSDVVSLAEGIANFADKNVGTSKVVNVTSLALSGPQAANYQLVPANPTTTANISKAPLLIQANDQSRPYGSTNPPLTVTYTGLLEPLANAVSGVPAVATTATLSSAPGNYPVTVGPGTCSAPNYELSYGNGSLTITRAPLMVAADNKWKIFNTANPPLTLSYIGLVNGETPSVLSGAPTITTTATTTSPVGSYPINVGQGTLSAANYILSFAGGSLAVVPAGTLWYDGFTRPTEPGSIAPWIAQLGTWKILSGVMQAGPNPAQSYAVAFITNSFADFAVEARFQFATGAFGGGLSGRLTTTNGARYAAWLYPAGSYGGSNMVKLVKFHTWTAFGYSNVISAPIAQALVPDIGTNSHTLKLVCNGNRIAVVYDGVRYFSVIDSEAKPYAAGATGLEMWSGSAADTMRVDDFTISLPPRPVAANDSYSTPAGATLQIISPGVLGNDYSELAPPTAVLVAGPAHGTLDLAANGGFVYRPTTGYIGQDSFTYDASDGFTNSATATVNITVMPNRAPVASNDSYTTSSGTQLVVGAPGVLANDSDPDGTRLIALLVTGPSNGTLDLNTNGGFVYNPGANFSGVDSFVYRANDGLSNSPNATVTITVTAASVLYTDDFARSGTPASLAPWIAQAGVWSITDGVLRAGTNALNSYGFVYLTNLWTDYSVEARLRFPAGAYGGGVGGRLNRTTGAHYAAWVYPAGSPGGSNVLKLIKFQNWYSFGYSNVVSVPMRQVSLPPVGTDWHALRIVFVGPQITAFWDDVQVASVIDAEATKYVIGGATMDMWTADTPWVMEADDVVVSLPRGDAQPPAITGIALNHGTKQVTVGFRGAPGNEYVVLASPSVTAPVTWTPVATNTAGGDGTWTYQDRATNTAPRFYRAAPRY